MEFQKIMPYSVFSHCKETPYHGVLENSWEIQHYTGACLQFQRFSPLSSQQGLGQHAHMLLGR